MDSRLDNRNAGPKAGLDYPRAPIYLNDEAILQGYHLRHR